MRKVNTGLKDRKGNDIFEGDIVLRHRNASPIVEEVKFKEFWSLESQEGVTSLVMYHNHAEVIGNVYETPELLEQ